MFYFSFYFHYHYLNSFSQFEQVISEMKSSFENKKISKENTGKDDPRSTFLFPLNSYTSSSDLLESMSPKVQMTSARNSKLTCMLGKYNIFMHGTYAYQATYYTVLQQSDDSSKRCQSFPLRSYLPHFTPLLYYAFQILSLPLSSSLPAFFPSFSVPLSFLLFFSSFSFFSLFLQPSQCLHFMPSLPSNFFSISKSYIFALVPYISLLIVSSF